MALGALAKRNVSSIWVTRMRAKANGIEIEFESHGDEQAPVVLLIMGLGAQLVRWPQSLVDGLVALGFRVIRFDNRDSGKSTSIVEGGVPLLDAIISGEQAPPYSLDDMVLDTLGLMDWLEIDKAHIIGASMGGMVGQLLASDHPHRVLSLTSIMSTTGNPELSPPDPQIFEKLNRPRPDPLKDLSQYLDYEVWRAGLIASPGFPMEATKVRACAQREFERGYNPDGVARQMAAIFSSDERRAKLALIKVPTLVVHGMEDPLIPPDAAEDTARSIPGARLMLVPGLAHDLPDQVMPSLCAAFETLVRARS